LHLPALPIIGCAATDDPTRSHWKNRRTITLTLHFGHFGFLHTEASDLYCTPGMLNSRSSRSTLKQQQKPKTVQRTYRFDTTVFEAFEEDCARHLSNPKRVIEALILHWLDADSDARALMAKTHRDKIGMSRED
jgi:hypothetical protein